MTLTSINKSRYHFGILYSSSLNDSDYEVVEDVILSSIDQVVFSLTGSNCDVEVRGVVTGNWGILLGDAVADTGNRLTVTARGRVQGVDHGVYISGAGEVRNAGEITARD